MKISPEEEIMKWVVRVDEVVYVVSADTSTDAIKEAIKYYEKLRCPIKSIKVDNVCEELYYGQKL